MYRRNPAFIALVWGLSVFCSLPGGGGEARAQQVPVCGQLLTTAELVYREQQFDEALAAVEMCLAAGDATAAERLRAYRLQVLIHLAREEADAARRAMLRIYALAPDYEPDPVLDPPAYTTFALDVKRQMEAEAARAEPAGTPPAPAEPAPPEQAAAPRRSWLRRNALMAVGGAVVSSVVLILAFGGGGRGPQPLPGPPGFPL